MGQMPHLRSYSAARQRRLRASGSSPCCIANRLAVDPAGSTDLRVDVLDVVAGGLRRDHEAFAICLLDRPRASRRSTSTSRVVRPAGWSRRRLRACPAAARTACHGVAVEPAGADLRSSSRAASVGASGRSIRTRLDHRLVDVRRARGSAPACEIAAPVSPRG